jgi:hypothetical protein
MCVAGSAELKRSSGLNYALYGALSQGSETPFCNLFLVRFLRYNCEQ